MCPLYHLLHTTREHKKVLHCIQSYVDFLPFFNDALLPFFLSVGSLGVGATIRGLGLDASAGAGATSSVAAGRAAGVSSGTATFLRGWRLIPLVFFRYLRCEAAKTSEEGQSAAMSCLRKYLNAPWINSASAASSNLTFLASSRILSFSASIFSSSSTLVARGTNSSISPSRSDTPSFSASAACRAFLGIRETLNLATKNPSTGWRRRAMGQLWRLRKRGRHATRTVVDVRPVSSSELHLASKVLAPERGESLSTELESSLDELDVGSLSEGVVDNGLVLVNRDGAGRVDEVTSRRRVGVDRVDGAEDELLLEVGEQVEVSLGLVAANDGEKAADRCQRRSRGQTGNFNVRKRTLLTLTVASFEITPVPLHGASSRTRSNPPMTLGNSRPS